MATVHPPEETEGYDAEPTSALFEEWDDDDDSALSEDEWGNYKGFRLGDVDVPE